MVHPSHRFSILGEGDKVVGVTAQNFEGNVPLSVMDWDHWFFLYRIAFSGYFRFSASFIHQLGLFVAVFTPLFECRLINANSNLAFIGATMNIFGIISLSAVHWWLCNYFVVRRRAWVWRNHSCRSYSFQIWIIGTYTMQWCDLHWASSRGCKLRRSLTSRINSDNSDV